MRHVIYLLLVANLVYFAWHAFQGTSQPVVAQSLPPIPATARPLVILQEREMQQVSTDAYAGDEDLTVVGVSPEAQTLSDIQTLSEEELIEEVKALTEAKPPGAGIPPTCRVLGPFELASKMKAAEDRLNKLGYSPQPRTSEVEEQTGYWIYLPAMTRKKALEVKRTLDGKNVRDYFIGKENFISLGIYNQKETADRRLERIRKLGLDPVIEPRYATSTVHWLDFNAQAGESPEWEQIRTEFPDTRLQELACR